LDLEVYGNGFIEIIRAGTKIIGLGYLPAITMYRNTNLTDFVQRIVQPNGLEVFNHFEGTEVIHFRHPDSSGGYYSLPMWYGGSDMMELLNAATAWNKAFFEQNAMPTYAIVTKGKPLNDAEMEAVQNVFRNDYKGIDNAHKTLLLHVGDLDAGIEFKQLTSNVKDGDFLKLLDACTGRITIAHGVPPRLLGVQNTDSSLAGGPELTAQLFSFETLTLGPRRRKLRDQMRPLLKEVGIKATEIEFQGLDLTPPDMDTANTLSMHQSQIIDTEEARERLQIDDNLSKTEVILALSKML
jgi:HK97 family phage portal protein